MQGIPDTLDCRATILGKTNYSEDLKDFRLFLTYPLPNGLFGVKTADDEKIQQIYDNGSDAFFNFEPFVAIK